MRRGPWDLDDHRYFFVLILLWIPAGTFLVPLFAFLFLCGVGFLYVCLPRPHFPNIEVCALIIFIK